MIEEKIEKKSTRDGFGEALLELGESNKDVVVLSADLTESVRAHWFRDKFPDRFVSHGVAEQDMIGTAAGLDIYDNTDIVMIAAANINSVWPSSTATQAAGYLGYGTTAEAIIYSLSTSNTIETHAGATTTIWLDDLAAATERAATENRPEIRGLLTRLDQTALAVEVAANDVLPTLDFFGSYGRAVWCRSHDQGRSRSTGSRPNS